MNKKLVGKLIFAAVTLFGTYKLAKYMAKVAEEVEESRRKEAEELSKYRKEVLNGIDYKEIAEKTLNNEKINVEDRTKMYEIYKKKLDAILYAKNKSDIDRAAKEFDEFTSVWLADYGASTSEIVAGYIRNEEQKREYERTKKEATRNRELELEKYKLIASTVTKGINTLASTKAWQE